MGSGNSFNYTRYVRLAINVSVLALRKKLAFDNNNNSNSKGGVSGSGLRDKAPSIDNPESASSSGSTNRKKGGNRSAKNSKTKQEIWCSTRKNERPLWYTPDLSVFARLVSSTYDAIEDRGLTGATNILTRHEFAICCYWYLYATWFAVYGTFWNTWRAPYPRWMQGTPRQYGTVFKHLKVPAVIHQAVMSVLTPMKAAGQIFYPCPGNLRYQCNYDDEGNPVEWEEGQGANMVDRETARYQVNFGNLYCCIVHHEDRADGNLPNMVLAEQRGYPGYDFDPPDEDGADPLPRVHVIISQFDFGYRYCAMPILMDRNNNFLTTIGLKDKEIVSYISIRDVPAPQDLVYSMFGLGAGLRPVPNGYLHAVITQKSEDDMDMVEEINTWSMGLFTLPFDALTMNQLNAGEVERCYVLMNPDLYLRAQSQAVRWFSYLPEMVRLSLNVAQIVLTDL